MHEVRHLASEKESYLLAVMLIAGKNRNNTIQLSFDIALLTPKFRSALTRLDGAHTVVLQSNCAQRTYSRFLHGSCLGRGSNLNFPCYRKYRPSALTKRPRLHNN